MHGVETQTTSYIQRIQEKAARKRHDDVPLLLSFERRWPILSGMAQGFGVVLILMAAVLWVLPGGKMPVDDAVLRLGVSAFFLICGVAIVTLGHADCSPEAYFDPARQELRVLQRGKNGRPHVVLRRSYDALGSVHFQGSSVELRDLDGSLLMRLSVQDRDVQQALRMQLTGCVVV